MLRSIRVPMVLALYSKLRTALESPDDIKEVLVELLALFISHHGGDNPRELLRLVYSDVEELVGILSTTRQVSAELDSITARVNSKSEDGE